jgi:hypothetical protein
MIMPAMTLFIKEQCAALPKKEAQLVNQVLTDKKIINHMKQAMLTLHIFPLSQKKVMENMRISSDLSQYILTETMVRSIGFKEVNEVVN